MKRWRGEWYYLATGMEGRAQQYSLGEIEAEDEIEARRKFAENEAGAPSPGWTKEQLIQWNLTCISVEEVSESIPDRHTSEEHF